MLSVIVPAYNEQNYIRQAVESICAQTYKDLEIILVNDGSMDETGSIMDALAKTDARIRVIHKPNGGLVSARKEGVAAANGEYITFVDGDDWIESSAYEIMLADCNNADIIMAGHKEDTGSVCKSIKSEICPGIYESSKLLEELYPGMLLQKGVFIEWKVFPGIWSKLFKKKLLEQSIAEVDNRITMGEDAAAVVPAILMADKICVIDKCFYHYRKTPNSMIGEIPPIEKERERFEVLYHCVNRQLPKYINKYDAREDWKRFMLFLMVPRADQLYCGYEALDYLYPFKNVKKGSKVVIYAAGTYGQRLYKYLKRTDFCKVALWVDANYAELQKMGLPVESPEKIREVDYDYIILPMSFEKSRNAVENHLKSLYPVEKVASMDVELIFSKKSLEAFGLLN